jgi:chemotaxis signal transduction protein
VNNIGSHTGGRASELRREFARSFTAPLRFDSTVSQDLLGIRAGDQRYAVRLSEIAGLHAAKKITSIPGAQSALRGISGFRGAILPVFDLQVLLGYAPADAPRWLMVAAAAPIGLAFPDFDGQLRVSPDQIVPQPSPVTTPGHTRELVRSPGFIAPVLQVAAILEAINASRSIQRRSDD